jgi:membrane fusion protein, multidrug efflux system
MEILPHMHVSSRLWLTSLVFAAAAVVGGCSAGGEAGSPQTAPGAAQRGGGPRATAVPVTTAPVVQRSVPLQVQAIGSVEALSTVSIRAQITGVLNEVDFKEGDDVKLGQVLFSLDRRPLEAALRQAQANLERDLAQAGNANAISQRYVDLAQRGIATREQVETSRASATALEATVNADRAAVENASVQLQYATIMAPLSGRTGALMVNVGNLVRANDTTPLVVINEVSPIFVSFAIPEAQIPDFRRYLAQGSVRVEARATGDTGVAPVGRITFVDNAVDQTTGMIKIKATFPNDDRRLWPGLFVNVVVTLTTDQAAVVVPTVAVQTGPQGRYVYVVKPDRTVDLRVIEIDRVDGTDTVVTTGLKTGETVVTDGQLRLVAGALVSVRGSEKVAS